MTAIPYARQSISDEDVAEVLRVLRSPFLTQGPEIERFEAALCELTGAADAIACVNATSALHLACLALGVGPGDRVWTSPNSFVASANCARYCGAEVDFVDIDPLTRNLDPISLSEGLREAAAAGRLPKAIVAVDYAGTPCDLAGIAAAARRYGVALIEDASHAVGATYHGIPVAGSPFADVTVFSFHPVKIVTTGEGGALLTNRSDVSACARSLRSHGITRDASLMAEEPQGAWYYEQHALGFNYRMTDLQAALGTSQLARLPAFLRRRNAIAQRYETLLRDLPLRLPVVPADRTSAWHLYPVELEHGDRAEVFDALRERGILVNVHYIPIHLQPYYRALGGAPGQFPCAERFYARAISLPMFAELRDDEQDRVVETMRDVLHSVAC